MARVKRSLEGTKYIAVKKVRGMTTASKKTAKPYGSVQNKKQYTFPYADGEGSTAIAAGATYQVLIKGNSMYDPDASVGGHQPMGFDQAAAVYKEFTVTKASATWHVTAVSPAKLYCFLWADTSSSVISADLNSLIESTKRAGGQMKIISEYVNHTPMYISKTTYDMLGKEDDDMKCTASGDPSKIWYIHAVAYNPAGTSQDIGPSALVVNYTAKTDGELALGSS